MDKYLLRQELEELKTYMLAEGILDSYFEEVETLQTIKYDYVENIIDTYFSTSAVYMDQMQQYLNIVPLDFNNVECLIYKLKGGCSSLGAAKVHAAVRAMMNIFKAKKFHRLNAAFQRIRVENATLKMYLEPYAELLRQLRFLERPNEASNNREEVESVGSNDMDGSNDADDYNENN